MARTASLSLILAVAAAALCAQGRGGGQAVEVPAIAFGAVGPNAIGSAATGTGLLLGRVVDAGTARPVPGATVTLSSTTQGGPNGGEVSAAFRPQSVVTGGDGAFVFRDLPKGDFSLRTMLPGYMPSISQSMSLADAEKVNDVELRLARSGVLAGQVMDEQNEGVEGITISLVRIDFANGRRTLRTLQSIPTDDRGAFRFSPLLPGDYTVCALFSRRIAPIAVGVAQTGNNADLRQTMSGSGAMSPSGSGYRLGDFMMIQGSGSRNVDPAPTEDGRFSVFADACYPSAPAPQSAQAVHIDSGQERSGVNLLLRVVPSARIFGTLVGPPNRVPGLGVHLFPAAADDAATSGAIEAAQTIADPSGGFGFIGVPAGSYVLRVVYAPRYEQGIPAEVINQIIAQGGTVPASFLNRPASPVPTEPTLWASAPITVGETDVTGVTLALREGVRVTGTIVFEGTQERPAADRLGSAAIGFEPADGSSSDAYPQPRGWVTPDAKFTTTGVVPGRYLVRPLTAWPGWTLKAVMADGRDVSDDPLDVASGDVTGVIVTMTDHPAELSGTVRDAAGLPDRRASVIVFPAERARWTRANTGRRTMSASVSRQGGFRLPGLPAGEYFVVAIPDQAGLVWQDPTVLDTLSRLATHVTIRDGEHRAVNLVTSVVR